MSRADELQALADLAQFGAHIVLDQTLALGPRPSDNPSAALLWDQTETRLRGQMNSLAALASKLNAATIIAALDEAQADLSELTNATSRARQRIEQIAEISELLTTLGRVLDVGLAVLALATVPSPTTALSLKKAVTAMVEDAKENA